jgi:endonuclease/exonuclease/phosphatase family metal-dependent hydrolase
MRSRIAATLAVVVALLCPMLAGGASASPRDPLRVLDYNIHTGIGVDGTLDLARTAEVIRSSGADIVGLQEVDVHWSARSRYVDQARELARLTGMRVFFAPIYDLEPEPGREERRQYGVAVLSRFPIVRAENHHLTRLSTVDPDPVPRPGPGFAEAVVAAPGGPVHVYVTHLDYRADPAVRSMQVADTLRILDQDRPGARQLLLGDFNAEPAAPELAPLFARMHDAAPDGEPTYPAEDPVKRIDYVTYSGRLEAVAAEVLPTLASDHRPVLATLDVSVP